ncbi:nitrogenase cofactor biosynthesis protein NifB [Sporomusa sphaeroides]|uniref:FeMo cofactor biosynthesis protein NifB n=1 Tax=Sporomusa sphaeroides DSM 2875 TaxID=1337886 RepID=A0ABP2C7T8_9FIRM|nr:nitrogenase cofactor biosynthesis protein NifB [Sporomusa sphaeroides]OLS55979.1 FeMo cofactor biosynthesis protein NifB [Sporomusa sphaeroides DSM 2875]CVK20190.1 FeMo cofactor biosynthesis protein NifB [Sporomusa sphaeroides DSM 2875]HML33576.1 nitrogenase cofactor biosynthesis protein NifB [Sporomusa sphaeroides]
MSSVLTDKHPCFSAQAQHQYARMHLPVAPRCNISCNYCSRKFDCVNESRPGVTSEILSPQEAREKFEQVKAAIPNLSVIGIAGPGDALANWEETRKTIELIKQENPEILVCLSTNGLLLPEYAPELIKLGVRHVTVTVNCIDPVVGAQIYGTINYEGKRYMGVEGSKILIHNQQEGIMYLAGHGVSVKVNIVMMKIVNDWHIPEVVKRVKELGACMTNIMPFIPAPGSVFSGLPQTSMNEVAAVRSVCAGEVKQMTHCRQCRADAIGLLGQDRSSEFRRRLRETEPVEHKPVPFTGYCKVAVTSKFGKLVDLHFGQAEEFQIYHVSGRRYELVETRRLEKYCGGTAECVTEDQRRDGILAALADCQAVLTMRIGYPVQKRLLKRGIMSVEYCYTVESGLLYTVEQLALRAAVG